MKLTIQREPRQQIFQLQSKVLSSLDRRVGERARRVFDQAWANRFWTPLPMLPTRPPQGWKRDKSREARQSLQNTYQTAAFAFDVGIPRDCLALAYPDFKHFRLACVEAVRLFDIRIGPPWWVSDRAFLEMIYTAVMAQEEPCDEDTRSSIESYMGDSAGDLTQWMAESWLDHTHSYQANILMQCQMYYYEQPSWDEKEGVAFPQRSRLLPGRDPLEAELSMLLNWQVLWQPSFAMEGLDGQDSYRARTAFPHRAEERRLIRLLNLQPRGRPQRRSVGTHA